jgi:DNA invertase Pin-like site-specific DNA recombinase
MIFGYLPVEQEGSALQWEALKEYGCHRFFQEHNNDSSHQQPVFRHLVKDLKQGDELVVWNLESLQRTTTQLIILLDRLRHEGIRFTCLSQPLFNVLPTEPAVSPGMAVISQLAAYERERTKQPHPPRDNRRARGRQGGRPRGLSPYYQQLAPLVRQAYEGGASIRAILAKFAIPSTATVYKILKQGGISVTPTKSRALQENH